MTIDTVKQLKAIMKLCQDHGVASISVDNIELKFEPNFKGTVRRPTTDYEAFPEASVRVPQYTPVDVQETANAAIEAIDMPNELTQEQLMFYSTKAEVQ